MFPSIVQARQTIRYLPAQYWYLWHRNWYFPDALQQTCKHTRKPDRMGTSLYKYTYLSQTLWMTPQYCSGTANHSVSPGPILIFIEQKLLFSWWPVKNCKENANITPRGRSLALGPNNASGFGPQAKWCKWFLLWNAVRMRQNYN